MNDIAVDFKFLDTSITSYCPTIFYRVFRSSKIKYIDSWLE